MKVSNNTSFILMGSILAHVPSFHRGSFQGFLQNPDKQTNKRTGVKTHGCTLWLMMLTIFLVYCVFWRLCSCNKWSFSLHRITRNLHDRKAFCCCHQFYITKQEPTISIDISFYPFVSVALALWHRVQSVLLISPAFTVLSSKDWLSKWFLLNC